MEILYHIETTSESHHGIPQAEYQAKFATYFSRERSTNTCRDTLVVGDAEWRRCMAGGIMAGCSCGW